MRDLAGEPLGGLRVLFAYRFGDPDVQGHGGRVGVLEHHLVMGAAGEDLGDHVPEPGEHLVARGVQHHPVEGDVVAEVLLQPLAARGLDHAEGAFGQGRALRGVAYRAASEAATGSIADRSTVSERSWRGRSAPASRQRMTRGS